MPRLSEAMGDKGPKVAPLIDSHDIIPGLFDSVEAIQDEEKEVEIQDRHGGKLVSVEKELLACLHDVKSNGDVSNVLARLKRVESALRGENEMPSKSAESDPRTLKLPQDCRELSTKRVGSKKIGRSTVIDQYHNLDEQRSVVFYNFSSLWTKEEKIALVERFGVVEHQVYFSKRNRNEHDYLFVCYQDIQSAIVAISSMDKQPIGKRNGPIRVHALRGWFLSEYLRRFQTESLTTSMKRKQNAMRTSHCASMLAPLLFAYAVLGLPNRALVVHKTPWIRLGLGKVYPILVRLACVCAGLVFVHQSFISWSIGKTGRLILCVTSALFYLLFFVIQIHTEREFCRPNSESSLFILFETTVGSKEDLERLRELSKHLAKTTLACAVLCTVIAVFLIDINLVDEYWSTSATTLIYVAGFYSFGFACITSTRLVLWSRISALSIRRLTKKMCTRKMDFYDAKHRYLSIAMVVQEGADREKSLFLFMTILLLTSSLMNLCVIFFMAGLDSFTWDVGLVAGTSLAFNLSNQAWWFYCMVQGYHVNVSLEHCLKVMETFAHNNMWGSSTSELLQVDRFLRYCTDKSYGPVPGVVLLGSNVDGRFLIRMATLAFYALCFVMGRIFLSTLT